MYIRETSPDDLTEILDVHQAAFGRPEVVQLTDDLLADPSSLPLISLLAFSEKEEALGHVLFTRAELSGHPDIETMILAPLAVIPERQNQGLGGKLTRQALALARERGCDLVFVLGHPDYYPRHGFQAPAGPLGFEAPYPIAEKDADAWMVQQFKPGLIGRLTGTIQPARAMMSPEHWQE